MMGGPVMPPFGPNAADTLKPLAICYIVYACLVGLAALLVPVYMLVFGAVFAAAAEDPSTPSGDAGGMMAAGAFMVAILGFAELLLITKLVLLILAAQGLFRLKRYGVIMAAAILSCLNMPLGLGLAIWTFVMISKPEIKAAFQQARTA